MAQIVSSATLAPTGPTKQSWFRTPDFAYNRKMLSIRSAQSPPAVISRDDLLVRSRNLSVRESDMFGCSFSRQWLIHLGHETLQIAEDGEYISKNGKTVRVAEAFEYAKKNSKHYHSSHIFDPSSTTTPKFETTEFHVCYGSSLTVATKLQEELDKVHQESEIGILNSASGRYPEKFLRGTMSQEEGIMRASFLYPCVAQYKGLPHHFYYVNHKPKYQESSSSCAIFCPRVPIIREDSVQGDLLDKPDFFSIVSIPAPNAFILGGGNGESVQATIPKAQEPGACERNEEYEHVTIDEAMHDRIFRALSIFAEQGCTDLVLCAFGCGVHGNNPKKIAQCFKDIICNELQGRFRVVVFAIQPSRHLNYEAFVEVFGEK